MDGKTTSGREWFLETKRASEKTLRVQSGICEKDIFYNLLSIVICSPFFIRKEKYISELHFTNKKGTSCLSEDYTTKTS